MKKKVKIDNGRIGIADENAEVGGMVEVTLCDENGEEFVTIGTVEEILGTQEDWVWKTYHLTFVQRRIYSR